MVQQIKRATREKFQLTGEKQPPVPYIFTTPQGQELDLRLFNRSDVVPSRGNFYAGSCFDVLSLGYLGVWCLKRQLRLADGVGFDHNYDLIGSILWDTLMMWNNCGL